MTEQEARDIEWVIRKLTYIATNLTTQMREIETRIQEVEKQRQTLVDILDKTSITGKSEEKSK